MINGAIYDASGKISMLVASDGPQFVAHLAEMQAGFIEGHWDADTHYIDLADPDNPTPTERPTQTTQLTGMVLSGLPVPCTIHINGEPFAHDEASVDLDFPLPGTYAVRVEAFPYLDWATTIPIT